MITTDFFNQNAMHVAQFLLGKVLRVYQQKTWLSAMIIETEAYFLVEKGSHASLGYTEKRKALFMSPGTIYMYYARGGDSLNVSCQGDGNAVLIKSAIPYVNENTNNKMIALMQQLNPQKNGDQLRPIKKLCAGQTLLCKSLGLKVPKWDQQQFHSKKFRIDDIGYTPNKIIQTTRLGIPQGRDEHLPYRFIDHQYAAHCTSNPLTKRNWQLGKEYTIKS